MPVLVSTKGRYGLRMMIDIARHQGPGNISLREIGERQGISVKYLEQLARSLCAAGLLQGSRGQGGGYVLGKPADSMTAGEILRATEGSTAPVSCLARDDATLSAPARLRDRRLLARPRQDDRRLRERLHAAGPGRRQRRLRRRARPLRGGAAPSQHVGGRRHGVGPAGGNRWEPGAPLARAGGGGLVEADGARSAKAKEARPAWSVGPWLRGVRPVFGHHCDWMIHRDPAITSTGRCTGVRALHPKRGGCVQICFE